MSPHGPGFQSFCISHVSYQQQMGEAVVSFFEQNYEVPKNVSHMSMYISCMH